MHELFRRFPEEERRWQERANCLGVDPELFFPERGASTREAKSVCAGCAVRLDCLEYALRNHEKFGIWGGLSERERRRLRRRRALGEVASPRPEPPSGLETGLDRADPGPKPGSRRGIPRCTGPVRRRGAAPPARARPRRSPAGAFGAHRRPCRFHPGGGQVDQVHRHLGPAPDGRAKPSARTPGSPPSLSRTARATAEASAQVVRGQLAVDGDIRLPGADRHRPSWGWGSAGPKSGIRALNASRRIEGSVRPSGSAAS